MSSMIILNSSDAKSALFYICILAVMINMSGAHEATFDNHFVELGNSKMITTGPKHYAICNHHFPSNWRSVSVNDEELTIVTKDDKILMKNCSDLTADEKSSVEKIKDTLMEVISKGPLNVKNPDAPESDLQKLTTFDRNGGSSVMGTGGDSSSSTSSSSSSSSNGVSISRTGKDSWIACKTNFPFNWKRVFRNEDVVTIVYTCGKVVMMPKKLVNEAEKAELEALCKEVEKSSKLAENLASDLTSGSHSPMDFVNKAMSGMFGR